MAYDKIEARQQEVDWLYNKYFGEKDKPQKPKVVHSGVSLLADDQELIKKACAASNRDKFAELYAGNWKGNYKSQSEADQALCNLLAFWCNCNRDQLNRIFKESGLYRKKWDRKDYSQRTIDKAIDSCTNTYEGKQEREAIQIESKMAETDERQQDDRPKFEFIHNAQAIENLKPIQWRIHGIMEDEALYQDYGDVGHRKTGVALDRLLSVASETDYHGHRVKQGTVFYIPGEGQQGVGRRIAAWHIKHGTKAAEVPFFVAKTVTDLMDPEAVDLVKQAIDRMAAEYGDPAVIHLDTLSRNFGSGDENSTKDMNRAINNLTTSFGGSMIIGLTHHTGHFNKERARGSIALRAACDHEYRITYQSTTGKVLVECKKMKDAALAPPMLFTTKEILFQIDDQRCSSYVLELECEGDEIKIEPEKNAEKMSKQMQKTLDALRQLYAKYEKNLAVSDRAGQMPNVAVKEWRAECLKKKIYSRSDSFNRAAESLLDRKYTVYDETGYYVYPVEIKQKYETDEI